MKSTSNRRAASISDEQVSEQPVLVREASNRRRLVVPRWVAFFGVGAGAFVAALLLTSGSSGKRETRRPVVIRVPASPVVVAPAPATALPPVPAPLPMAQPPELDRRYQQQGQDEIGNTVDPASEPTFVRPVR